MALRREDWMLSPSGFPFQCDKDGCAPGSLKRIGLVYKTVKRLLKILYLKGAERIYKDTFLKINTLRKVRSEHWEKKKLQPEECLSCVGQR